MISKCSKSPDVALILRLKNSKPGKNGYELHSRKNYWTLIGR
jgi:hypothetical protein